MRFHKRLLSMCCSSFTYLSASLGMVGDGLKTFRLRLPAFEETSAEECFALTETELVGLERRR